MSRSPAQPRWGSNGQVLASRWMIAKVTCRYPATIARNCTPVACDVATRALLYDVDEADAVLQGLLPGSPRVRDR